MDKQDSEIAIIGGVGALAVLVYMYASRGQSTPSAAPAGSSIINLGATMPQPAEPLTPAINIPSIKIPSSNVTIKTGQALFPLFGYAAGSGGIAQNVANRIFDQNAATQRNMVDLANNYIQANQDSVHTLANSQADYMRLATTSAEYTSGNIARNGK